MNLGNKLRIARKEKGYSLKQIELLTGIPAGTLHAYEVDKIQNISIDRLKLLSELYQKDPNYFLLESKTENKDKEFNLTLRIFLSIISNIISQFELLDEKNKNKLIEYISKFIKKNNQ